MTVNFTGEQFEKIVQEGIRAIPRRFLDKLDNVAIIIERDVSPIQRQKLKLRNDWTLFGLYEGVPQTARGGHYTNVLPDKITIFQGPIEKQAADENEAREIVKNTVWHEIAHHFGMDEEAVRRAESRKLSEK
jgi:predicted Zn-dependent protease with MMP-like domain